MTTAPSLTPQEVDTLLPEQSPYWKDMFLTPEAYRRAGRAAGFSEATGGITPSDVRNPKATLATRSLIATPLGMILGGLLGSQLKTRTAMLDGSQVESNRTGAGVMGGGALGGLIAAVLSANARRKQEQEIREAAIQAATEGKPLRPVLADSSNPLEALTSGVYAQGKADVAEAQAFGRRNFDGNKAMAALQAVGYLPGGSVLAAPLGMAGQMINHADASRRMSETKPALRFQNHNAQ